MNVCRKVSCMAALLVAASASAVQGAPFRLSGSFATPTQQGSASFVPTRAVIQWGYQGNLKLAGKNFAAALMIPRNGNGTMVLVWYRADYTQAGQAVMYVQADASYAGVIDFTNRRGVVTDSGTIRVVVGP